VAPDDRVTGGGDVARRGGSQQSDRGNKTTHAADGNGTVDRVLTDVRRVLGLDREPPPAAPGAAAAGSWLAIDADLATVAYDSTGDEGSGFSGLRSAGTVLRQLSFDVGGRSVDIEMAVTSDHVRVLGQINPPRPVTVHALWPGGSQVTVADDAGLFRFDNLSRMPFSFHVVGDPDFKTGWIVP
jgi:hypothetical protein